MKQNKIAIIIPYFGHWPEWFDLYIFSCEQNNQIDWYFFTDCIIPKSYSSNIYFKSTSFSDYCINAGKILGINFKPTNPYKLCGLRPFEGHIHYELLKPYDFWGWGDLDIIWGNIKSFYSNKLLSKYDVFSNHADRVSGHFAIIRNQPKYTELCFQIQNWQSKLEDQTSIPLDEQDFSWLLYPQSRIITKLYSKVIRNLFNWRDAWVIYYHFMPTINRLFRIKSKNLFFKEQHTTPILGGDGRTFTHDSENWLYENGKIINLKNKKEYIYLHFMIFKKNSFRDDYFWKENYYHLTKDYDFSNGVRINTKGIFSIK